MQRLQTTPNMAAIQSALRDIGPSAQGAGEVALRIRDRAYPPPDFLLDTTGPHHFALEERPHDLPGA